MPSEQGKRQKRILEKKLDYLSEKVDPDVLKELFDEALEEYATKIVDEEDN